jgi:heat shock protein HtpX
MMRILLFLATNLAVVLIASITLSLFGFNGFMAANGVDLNLNQLLIFCAVFVLPARCSRCSSPSGWRR